MISAQSDGIMLGVLVGFDVSISVGSIVGIVVGPADGKGDGSGVGLQSIRSCGFKHSSGQQSQDTPGGNGICRHMVLPIDSQLTGLSFESTSQQAVGHSSIKWLQDVGIELGVDEGADDGAPDGLADGLPDASVDGGEDGTGVGTCVGLQLILSSGSRH